MEKPRREEKLYTKRAPVELGRRKKWNSSERAEEVVRASPLNWDNRPEEYESRRRTQKKKKKKLLKILPARPFSNCNLHVTKVAAGSQRRSFGWRISAALLHAKYTLIFNYSRQQI